MSIEMQFINIIVPLQNLKKCREYNNLTKVLSRYNPAIISKIILHDNYIFRDGAMNWYDINAELQFWKKQGLKLTKIKNHRRYWCDLCVVDMSDGPTKPCDWLQFVNVGHGKRPYVYYKNKPKGRLVKIVI